MNGDHVTVLDSEVVSDDTVNSCAAIIEVVVGQDDENGVLPLLATNQNSVTTEKLERVHGGF